MNVFVLNQHGEALMPCKPRKAKILLRTGKAQVIKRNPFTIQLYYGVAGYKQPLILGVDTGHSTVGLSVISATHEVFSAIATLRNDISNKMQQRASYRRTRRGRLRYRPPRFNNRSASTQKGRLPPSVQWKTDAHETLIRQLSALLPLTKIVLETATFDMAKMQNPHIRHEQYQQGVQYGFENVKAYVLSRDGHRCQSKKRGCSPQLETHHIQFRSQGGSDAPTNLITLCSTHHASLHEDKWTLNVKRHQRLCSATVMNMIRKRLLERFPRAIETFGYITKANRYALGIEKTHANDAFVIAGGTHQQRSQQQTINFKRKNNRALQKNRNGFAPAIRRQRYPIQPQDIIAFEGKHYVSKGSQNKGAYIVFMQGAKRLVKNSKAIQLVFQHKGIIYA